MTFIYKFSDLYLLIIIPLQETLKWVNEFLEVLSLTIVTPGVGQKNDIRYTITCCLGHLNWYSLKKNIITMIFFSVTVVWTIPCDILWCFISTCCCYIYLFLFHFFFIWMSQNSESFFHQSNRFTPELRIFWVFPSNHGVQTNFYSFMVLH